MVTTSVGPSRSDQLLVSAADAAFLLNISPRTLARLTATREIRAVRAGRSVRYDRRDLEQWIERAKDPKPRKGA